MILATVLCLAILPELDKDITSLICTFFLKIEASSNHGIGLKGKWCEHE